MYKQAPKSPAMKALVGNQKNLPAGLKAQIEASPGKMMDSPAKQTKKVHTDEMGREGHFNPYTAQTKASQRPHAAVDSKYTKKYQNKVIESTDGGRAEKIGYKEDRMHRTHKRDAIMGLRADAYTANANNFGVKKPQVNITSAAKKKAAKSPAKKSKAKVEQDYARNAIADYKKGDKKAAGYEKKKALEVAAGEGK
jgi:hypothetical protein